MSLVSIGLPVYNGEAFLDRTIESFLSQTYEDIELLLCDNASTDRSPEICREWAAKDPRVSFHPSDVNRGASWNFDRSFHLARGEYFKWAAHDDLCDPRFVEACLGVLKDDPGVVVCHTQSDEVYADGSFKRHLESPPEIGSDRPGARFAVVMGGFNLFVFGVIRASTLSRTRLMDRYVGSDTVLVAELALLGRLAEVPETLFWRYEHPETSQNAYDKWERLGWFDAAKAGSIDFPTWRMTRELLRAVSRHDLSREDRRTCFGAIRRYVRYHAEDYPVDLFEAAKSLLRRTGPGRAVVDGLKRASGRGRRSAASSATPPGWPPQGSGRRS